MRVFVNNMKFLYYDADLFSLQFSVVISTVYLTLANQNTNPVGEYEPRPFYGKFDEVDDLPPAPDDLRYAFIVSELQTLLDISKKRSSIKICWVQLGYKKVNTTH